MDSLEVLFSILVVGLIGFGLYAVHEANHSLTELRDDLDWTRDRQQLVEHAATYRPPNASQITVDYEPASVTGRLPEKDPYEFTITNEGSREYALYLVEFHGYINGEHVWTQTKKEFYRGTGQLLSGEFDAYEGTDAVKVKIFDAGVVQQDGDLELRIKDASGNYLGGPDPVRWLYLTEEGRLRHEEGYNGCVYSTNSSRFEKICLKFDDDSQMSVDALDTDGDTSGR